MKTALIPYAEHTIPHKNDPFHQLKGQIPRNNLMKINKRTNDRVLSHNTLVYSHCLCVYWKYGRVK